MCSRGFGFYASFVVPVGNEVLGSFEESTVTCQVTVGLNAFASGILPLSYISKPAPN